MLGRHNITIYADELERCIGSLKLAANETGDMEGCYFLGARNALELLYSPDMPDNATAFVAALKLHFEEEK